jgi:hypothetical protein
VLTLVLFGIARYPFDLIGVLSEGAILASLGTALLAMSDMLEKDKLERVKQNTDILFRDIIKQPPWRRWPFLKRKFTRKTLIQDRIVSKLENPKLPFDVGTHTIEVSIPTVQEDFFDLPVLKNLIMMKRYFKAFLTLYSRNKEEGKKSNHPFDTFNAFLSLYDSWKAILLFRIARFIKTFSIGLVLSSIIMTVLCIIFHRILGFL